MLKLKKYVGPTTALKSIGTSKPSTKAPPRNYTPPPPPVKMGAGGAAAASVAMLGKGKQTSKTGNGRYQS